MIQNGDWKNLLIFVIILKNNFFESVKNERTDPEYLKDAEFEYLIG
jgi:hypothetical protein